MKTRSCALAMVALTFSGGSAAALTVTPTNSALTLVDTILGPGVSLVGAPTLTGGPGSAGTFTGGLGSVPISSGIVLSSGVVSQIPGANATGPEMRGAGGVTDDDLSTDFGLPGDPSIPNSFDAASLEFMFQCGDGSVGGSLNFGYVFASEEYIDFIDTEFNDEFDLLINGVDVALVNGQNVNINNVNDVDNAGFYVNNVTNTNGLPVAGLGMKFDGRTSFLVARALNLGPGVHTAKFVVADVGDGILDAAVFVQAGSFSPDEPRPDIPVPAALPLLASGIAALAFLRRRRRA